MKAIYLTAVLLFMGYTAALAQQDSVVLQPDTGLIITTDSLLPVETTVQLHPAADLRPPKRALIRSLLIPGWGQIYNKRIWKVPIVYGALGGMTALALWNRGQYRTFAEYYRKSIDNEPHPYSNTNAQTLRSVRDGYRQDMELSWIGVGAVYLLQGLEAYINAHLKTFDIEDDIGLRIRPVAPASALGPTPGIGVALLIR